MYGKEHSIDELMATMHFAREEGSVEANMKIVTTVKECSGWIALLDAHTSH